MNLTELNRFGNRYAKAWCSQDPASVAAFFNETGSLSINENAPAIGRSEIARVAQSFMTDFPDIQVTMDDLLPQAQGTVFHWTLTGTNTGPNGTGQHVHIKGYEVWTFGADHLIASSKGHYDADDYAHQLQHGANN